MGDHVVSVRMQLLISADEDFCGSSSFLFPFIKYYVFSTTEAIELPISAQNDKRSQSEQSASVPRIELKPHQTRA